MSSHSLGMLTEGNDRLIYWRLRETPLAWVLGVDSARRWHRRVGWSSPANMVTYIATLVLVVVVGALGILEAAPFELYVATSVLAWIFFAYCFVFFVDSRIFGALAPTLEFTLTLFVALIATVVTSSLFSFDTRTVIVFSAFVPTVVLTSSLDAMPYFVRRVSYFIDFAFVLLWSGMIVFVSLQRFPNMISPVVPLGTIGGLALRPVEIDARQLSADALITMTALQFRAAFIGFRQRNTKYSVFLRAHVSLEDDPDEHVFDWLRSATDKCVCLSRRCGVEPAP